MNARLIPFLQGVISTIAVVVLCAQAGPKTEKLVVRELVVRDENGNRVRISAGTISVDTKLKVREDTFSSSSRLSGTALVFGKEEGSRTEVSLGGLSVRDKGKSLLAASWTIRLEDAGTKDRVHIQANALRMERGELGALSGAIDIKPGDMSIRGKRRVIGISPDSDEPVKLR